jgi:1-deoxy-D-xylulose-5-phosphate reductoisomerase
MKQIALLGSTGQIGTRVLDVVRQLPGFRVHSLVARSSWEKVRDQILEFRPDRAVLLDEAAAAKLRESCAGSSTRIESGPEAMLQAVSDPAVGIVTCAISGAAGLLASHRAVELGKNLALANKESIVLAGELLMDLSARSGSAIVPVDSEHSAIFQCLLAGRRREIRRVIITGSGGPFRTFSREQMELATPEQALKHPTWQMGPKITIDSATLMNKALEIIEARHLFGLSVDQIEVLIHPQSIVHSMVEFVDGSVMAQLSLPDMRIPIQYALTFPDRAPNENIRWLDLAKLGSLTFEAPDPDRFPALRFGRQVAEEGGTSGACLNAADEVAIDEFLAGRIRFPRILGAIEHVLSSHRRIERPSLDQIFETDRWARVEVHRFLGNGRAALAEERRPRT